VTLTFSEAAHMNNLFFHDGNPPVNKFSCNAALAVGVGCVTTDQCSLSPACTATIPTTLAPLGTIPSHPVEN
jgi:hypothetical protein